MVTPKRTGLPRKIPGRSSRQLSPAEFYERTAMRAPAEEMLGENFGLAVREIAAIDPKGITLEDEVFTHPELDVVLSNSGSGRKFFLKYDVVQFARGALDSVLVYEVDEHGCVELKLEAINEKCAGDLMSPERILALRRQQDAALLATRDNAEQQLLSLRKGTAARERLLDDRSARSRNRARNATESVAPAPARAPEVRAGSARASTMDVLGSSGPDPAVDSDAGSAVPDGPTTVERSDPPTRRRRSTRDLLTGETRQQENEE